MELTLKLDVFGEALSSEVVLPAGRTEPRRLLPVLREVADKVVASAVAREAAAGRSVSCQRGCTACCHQLVPLGGAEAAAMRELVEQLPAEERDRVRRRFTSTLERLAAAGLLSRLRGRRWSDDDRLLHSVALAYLRLALPCPFLEGGACSIYDERPMACRQHAVTSPMERCQDPSPETVRPVPLPFDWAAAVARMDGGQRSAGSLVPLVLALEARGALGAPTQTAAELIARLFRPARS